MDEVGNVMLAIAAMLVWIAFWLWFGLFGLSIGGKAIDPVSTYIRRKWLSWNQWYKKPRTAIDVLQWRIRVVAIIAICFAFASYPVDWLDDYRGEIAGIAFTVLVIAEVDRKRSKLEFKESVIRQMASRSNHFALDAVHIARGKKWLEDGSLQGANLREANLQDAPLEYANLQDADLQAAKLQGADLFKAKLQGAILVGAKLQGASLRMADLQGASLFLAEYNKRTKWPEGFGYKATGAIPDDE